MAHTTGSLGQSLVLKVKRTQGEQHLVTTSQPMSVHSGEPDASCPHVLKNIKHVPFICTALTASQGTGHFWRQYFKTENWCFPYLGCLLFLLSFALPPLFRITCCIWGVILFPGRIWLKKLFSLLFIQSLNKYFFWEPNTSSPVSTVGIPTMNKDLVEPIITG